MLSQSLCKSRKQVRTHVVLYSGTRSVLESLLWLILVQHNVFPCFVVINGYWNKFAQFQTIK